MAEAKESVMKEDDVQTSGVDNLVTDGHNKDAIRCQHCPSLMLNALQAKFIQKQIFLPHMHKKSETQKPEDGETLEKHWIVDNMFTFENIGFSNAVGTVKYLICADCEIGPVGYQDMNDKTSIYLAIDRVRHNTNK